MTPTSLHAQAFWLQLDAHHRDWLFNRAQQHQQKPPNDWVAWYGDTRFLGWVPQTRAEQMVVFLPGCNLANAKLVWSTAHQNGLQRSHDLQAFLLDQAARGRLQGWRDEFFCLWESPTLPPNPQIPPWLCVERAGFRHLGLMSHAVHINGFCADGSLWCGHRAHDKPTDPDLFDNLSAGGLPAGEDALCTAHRELKEEAGFTCSPQHALSWAGGVRTQRNEPQGWHDEILCVYNLDVPSTFKPVNQDGEVQGFYCWQPAEVLDRMQAGKFTHDAVQALCQGLGLHGRSDN